MNAHLLLLALALALSSRSDDSREGCVLRAGERWLGVNRLGVVVDSPPRGVEALDGPWMPLRGNFGEWYGLSYRTPLGAWNGCAAGNLPEWGEREPIQPIAFRCDGERALSVSRLGDLELATEFWFDPDGRALLVGVVVTNLGAQRASDIVYSREAIDGFGRAPGWTWPPDMAGDGPLPPGLMRKLWMLDDLTPGASGGITFSYGWPGGAGSGQDPEVPLAFWTNPTWPNGLQVGLTSGAAMGDYDADGWTDFFVMQSGRLWRNLQGQDWQIAGNLHQYMDAPGIRYSASFGDFDDDGLPDIATEPRIGGCFHLMKNLGGAAFLDVAPLRTRVDFRVCDEDSETACWGDVDGDGDLDLFLPIYPPWVGSSDGNRFWRNLGPFDQRRNHRMQEFTEQGGFGNPPPDSARPEGAQFCDVDRDGDLDLFSNGTLYQNRSSFGLPRMHWMSEEASGIGFAPFLEEGLAFGDHDLDGDIDLFIAYLHPSLGVVIWENRGDGTYFRIEPGVIESHLTGLALGLSIADWDGDGDLDFTTRQVFRRSFLVESGVRRYAPATNDLDPAHTPSLTPCWADWDRDGDLDCLAANGGALGWFYENTLYGPATPASERRYLRVKPVRDSARVPAGLETEYGAVAEVRVLDAKDPFVRRLFTSSSAGYLNQSEYALHFGLPPDPAPQDDGVDLHLEVFVDFPGLPSQGYWRVDRHVNPVLGDIDLATLAEREIRVWRGGTVLLDGVLYPPTRFESPRLQTAGRALGEAHWSSGLPPLEEAGGPDAWVGIDFDTLGAVRRARVRELVLDGQLDLPRRVQQQRGNVVLWDVTEPGSPRVVEGGALRLSTSPRNSRSWFPVDWLLETGRRYRLVARVTERRATAVEEPFPDEPVRVHGGLAFHGSRGTTEAALDGAPVDPGRLWLTLRYGVLDVGALPPAGSAAKQ